MRGSKAIGLTILSALGLMLAVAGVALLFEAMLEVELDLAILFSYLALTPVILWLIRLAYPPKQRTWWRWTLLVGLWYLTGIVAAILLPWRAITRSAWQEENQIET
jgi:amino acid transporter